MYILLQEPSDGNLREAFRALDEEFGTTEFSLGQATTVIANALEVEPSAILGRLESGGYIGEV